MLSVVNRFSLASTTISRDIFSFIIIYIPDQTFVNKSEIIILCRIVSSNDNEGCRFET